MSRNRDRVSSMSRVDLAKVIKNEKHPQRARAEMRLAHLDKLEADRKKAVEKPAEPEA